MSCVVRVENLSKKYRLGGMRSGGYLSLREVVANGSKEMWRRAVVDPWSRLGGNPADRRSSADEDFWALRDVSFEIGQGDRIGIIGRNGAGKSTLLKLLSRITEPSGGRISIRGRVASLLEVGTGFHRELTGRENIYLNGTILGMTKKEVDRKFDEIVDFSDVERFIDTPVKRYSSGMAVRLAFAVAAHLEPEILIVDEVLAVGDVMFQKKCISKMQDVRKQGRTVLFVSHNMPAVSMLCNRAILLSAGQVVMDGSPHEVISRYLNSDEGVPSKREWPDPAGAPGRDVTRLGSIRVVGRDGRTVSSVDVRDDVGIEMVFDVLQPGYKLLPHYWFYNEEGAMMKHPYHDYATEDARQLEWTLREAMAHPGFGFVDAEQVAARDAWRSGVLRLQFVDIHPVVVDLDFLLQHIQSVVVG